MHNSSPKRTSRDQSKDAGLALILILNITGVVFHYPIVFQIQIVLLVLVMIFPMVFKPIAYVWFGLSNILGSISSFILLSAIFFLIVFPIGIIRRALGSDSFHQREWKQDTKSVFVTRDHIYTNDDISNPY